VTKNDGPLLWSVEDDDSGRRFVLVIRATDKTDPGIRLPMARETAEWLLRKLTDAVTTAPGRN
jgi:hypothetical protein